MSTPVEYAAAVKRIRELEAERDAYADTLKVIADQAHASDVAPIVAQLVLDERGYLPFGRLRETEAGLAAAVATVARVRAVLDHHERTRRTRFQAGLHPGTSLVDAARVRAALDGAA